MSLNLRNLRNGRENAYTFVCGDNNDPCRWGKAELLNGRSVKELPVTSWEFEVIGREEIRVRLRNSRKWGLLWEFSQVPKEFVRPYRWPDSFRLPTYNLEALVNAVCEQVDEQRRLAAATEAAMQVVGTGGFVLAKGVIDSYEAAYPLSQHEEAPDGMYTVYKDGRKFHAGVFRKNKLWYREDRVHDDLYQELKEAGLPVEDWQEPAPAGPETIWDQSPLDGLGMSPEEYYRENPWAD